MGPQIIRTQFDLPEGLSQTYIFARYCQHAFLRRFDPSHRMPPFSRIPLKIKSELEQISQVVYEAFQNNYDLTWALVGYFKSLKDPDYPDEDSRQAHFGPFSNKVEDSDRYEMILEPAFYRDRNNVPVAWHLPAILQPHRAALILSAVQDSQSKFGRPPFTFREVDSWRSGADYYREADATPSGVCTMFPLGFVQGSELPGPSTSFTAAGFNGNALYHNLSESLAIVGAITSLVHPVLFAQGLEFFERVHKGNIPVDQSWTYREVLSMWTPPFTSFSLYSNHSPPPHRDEASYPFAFDTFVSAGFSTENRFVLESVGHEYHFRSGDVVVTFSNLFPHRWSSAEGTLSHIVGVGSFNTDIMRHVSPSLLSPLDNFWTCEDFPTWRKALDLQDGVEF